MTFEAKFQAKVFSIESPPRVWNQTTARGRAASIAHFVEACETLFQGRPCIGCPADVQESDHYILHTPVPRKISNGCQKFLGKSEHGSQTCPKCLSLSEDLHKFEVSAGEMCSVDIKAEEDEEPISDITNTALKTDIDDKKQSKRKGSAKKAGNGKFLTRKTFTGKCKWCDQGGN